MSFLMYDPLAPNSLIQLQEWMGKAISTPLLDVEISEEFIKEEAKNFLVEPTDRIEVYNQQYYWRLLSALQETYPFLVRLLGYYTFNKEIGVPYLKDLPPNHWSFIHLGDRLDLWMKSSPFCTPLMINAAKIDTDYTLGFNAEEFPQVSSLEALEEKTLRLQPFVTIYKFSHDLFQYRESLLKKEVEFWQENPLPPLEPSESYFLLYRNSLCDMRWSSLEPYEYLLLQKIQEGISINDLCGWIETQNEAMVDTCFQKLGDWFAKWTKLNLLNIDEENCS